MKHETFTIESDPKNLQPLREKIGQLLQTAGFDSKTTGSILVALGEAVTNSIRHSYHNEPHKPIEIHYEDSDSNIRLRIRDYGEKVDLAKIQAKENPTLPPENAGGLGIFFMKKIMDKVSYITTHADGNELVLIKKK